MPSSSSERATVGKGSFAEARAYSTIAISINMALRKPRDRAYAFEQPYLVG